MKYKIELSKLDSLLELSGKIAVLEYRLGKLKEGSINYIKMMYETDKLKKEFQQKRGNIMMPSNFIK